MSIIPEAASERRQRMLDEQQQGATYLSHTDPDLDVGGRYAKQDGARAQVIGQSSAPSYPAAADWVQTELPPEPPLGLSNPALENPPAGASPGSSPVAPGGADAPSAVSPPCVDDVEHAAPPSSQDELR